MNPGVKADWPKADLEAVPACPACGERRRRPLYRGLRDRVFGCAAGSWDLHECEGCASAYLDPRPTPASIGRAYSDYYTHESADSTVFPPTVGRLAKFKERLRNGYLKERYGLDLRPALPGGGWLVPLLFPLRARAFDGWVGRVPLPRPGARLLDIGAGGGDFVRRAARIGWRAEGMDPDAAAVAAAVRTGVNMRQGSLPESGLEAESFDAVTMTHVVEHLHDPRASLAEVFRILKPGGRLCLATPNIGSLLRRRLGADWLALDPPRHLVLFNHDSLARVCREAGFAPVRFLSPGPSSEWMLVRSRRMAEGIAPFGEEPVKPLEGEDRRLARRLTLASLLRSQWGEEVLLVARKPAGR